MSERITYFPIEGMDVEFSVPQVVLNVHKKEIVPFTGNSILYATSESGTKVVIKISTSNSGAQREWKGLNMAHGAGLSVPEPYALAKSKDNEKLIIFEKVEGELLYTSNQTRLRIDLGEIVKDMHNQIFVSGNGWVSSGKPDFSYYEKLLNRYLKSSLNELKAGSETHTILNKFVNVMSYYCKTITPVFNHNDLHDGQIIVKPNQKLVLLDFENWKEETQLNEISYYLFHLIKDGSVNRNFDKFINGYLKSYRLTDTEKSVMTFYLLFISARAIDYFKNTGSKYLQKALETHKKVLRYTNDERLWKDY